MDVSHTEHSHVIGKGGNNIKRVMEETGCHIHFPDSNRNNQAEKSNQVCRAATGIQIWCSHWMCWHWGMMDPHPDPVELQGTFSAAMSLGALLAFTVLLCLRQCLGGFYGSNCMHMQIHIRKRWNLIVAPLPNCNPASFGRVCGE